MPLTHTLCNKRINGSETQVLVLGRTSHCSGLPALSTYTKAIPQVLLMSPESAGTLATFVMIQENLFNLSVWSQTERLSAEICPKASGKPAGLYTS